MAKAKTSQADSGFSRTPRGPWVGKPFRDALRVAVLRQADDDKLGKTKLDKLAGVLVREAIAGDVPALKEIADRLDGKVPQGIVGGGEDDNPIRHVHRVELVDLKGGA